MNENITKKIEEVKKNTKATSISNKTVYKDNFVELLKEEYKLPNNKIISRDRVIKNNGKEAVIIVAITEENKFLVVIQNRVNEIVSVEFPAGYIENDETVEEATARELLEETGYVSNDVTCIDSYYSDIGLSASIVNIVVAKNCRKVGNQQLGESEYINYLELTFKEVQELIEKRIMNSVGDKLAFYEVEKQV